MDEHPPSPLYYIVSAGMGHLVPLPGCLLLEPAGALAFSSGVGDLVEEVLVPVPVCERDGTGCCFLTRTLVGWLPAPEFRVAACMCMERGE